MTEVFERICNRCKRMLALENFNRQGSGKYGRQAVCRECKRTEGREAARTGRWPSFTRDGQRTFNLRTKYGITPEQYESLFLSQDKKCALCRGTEINANTKSLNMPVDHDHGSLHVRGILCGTCNMWLGNYEEFVSKLPNGQASIIEYLVPKDSWLTPDFPKPKDRSSKCCGKCGAVKLAAEFTVNKGYMNANCKQCEAERVRNYYAANQNYRKAVRDRSRRSYRQKKAGAI